MPGGNAEPHPTVALDLLPARFFDPHAVKFLPSGQRRADL